MVVQYIIIQSFKIMYYKNLIWSKKKKKDVHIIFTTVSPRRRESEHRKQSRSVSPVNIFVDIRLRL